MGRQTGPLQIEGRIGNLSFYFDKNNGYIVRRPGGASKERIMRDEQFARTRENASEFGNAMKAGKLIRHAVRGLLGHNGDTKVSQRLTSRIMKVVKLDAVNERGKRTLAEGLAHAAGMEELYGLAFYERSPLGTVLPVIPGYAAETGVITFGMFDPVLVKAPEAATHVCLRGVTVVFDFEKEGYKGFLTEEVVVGLASAGGIQDLACSQVPEGEGTRLVFLSVVFLQELNGEKWALKEGRSIGVVK